MSAAHLSISKISIDLSFKGASKENALRLDFNLLVNDKRFDFDLVFDAILLMGDTAGRAIIFLIKLLLFMYFMFPAAEDSNRVLNNGHVCIKIEQ